MGGMGPTDDFPEILQLARQGDQTALAALLELVRPWLERAARGYADPERPDESTADLTQAAWLRVWQGLGQFQGAGRRTRIGDQCLRANGARARLVVDVVAVGGGRGGAVVRQRGPVAGRRVRTGDRRGRAVRTRVRLLVGGVAT